MRTALALVAVALAASAARAGDEEPSAGGRPLSAWIRVLKEEAWNADARKHLIEIGAPAVPALLEMIKGKDDQPRRVAGWVLQGMGKEAAGAVPTLVEEMVAATDRRVRNVVAAALSRIGEPAVPALAVVFRDGARLPEARLWAAFVLGEIGPASAPAVPDLAAALAPGDAALRSQVLRALAGIGPGAGAAVLALTGLLDDADGEIAGRAARALGRVGEPARGAVDRLAVRLHDERVEVRAGAAVGLGLLGEERDGVVSTLVRVLRAGDRGERTDAIDALAGLAPRSRSARGGLRVAFATEAPNTFDMSSLEAALALVRAGDVEDDVVRVLLDWQERGTHVGSRDLGKEAAAALAPFGERVVRVLGARLDGPAEGRWTTARRLAEMGAPGAASLIAALRRSGDPEAQAIYAGALETMGAAAKDAVPDLQRLAASSDRSLATAAQRALLKIGDASGAYAMLLSTGTLKSRLEAIRRVHTRGGDGSDAEAVPPLVETMKSRALALRSASVEALARIGEPAVPALLRELAGPVQSVREDAAAAFVRMQEHDPTPALLPLLEHDDDDVRAAAEHAVFASARTPSPALVDVLVREFGDSTPEHRREVVRWVAERAGHGHAATALPLLRRAVADADVDTAEAALLVLVRTPPEDAETLAAVVALDPHGDDRLVRAKANTLDSLGAPPAARVAAWVAVARLPADGPGAGSYHGVETATFDADAVPFLAAAAREPEPPVRAAAMRWLAATSERTPEVLGAVRAGLSDAAGTVRTAAADALSTLGAAEEQDVQRLLEIAQRESSVGEERAAMLRALGALAPASPGVLETIVALALRLENPLGSAEAASLAAIAQREEAGRLAVLELLRGDDAHAMVGLSAVEVSEGRRAPLDDLVALTRSERPPRVRALAAHEIGAGEAPAAEVVRVLGAVLTDPDAAVAAEAIIGLARYRKEARDLLPAIERRVSDGGDAFRENWRVQQALHFLDAERRGVK